MPNVLIYITFQTFITAFAKSVSNCHVQAIYPTPTTLYSKHTQEMEVTFINLN